MSQFSAMYDRQQTWGRMYPADYKDEGGSGERKWFPWTINNDLAGERWMIDNPNWGPTREHRLYLVRCSACKHEEYSEVAVYKHDRQECLDAIAILSELIGEEGQRDIFHDDAWYTDRESRN